MKLRKISALVILVYLSFTFLMGASVEWKRSLTIGDSSLDSSSIFDTISTTKGTRPCPIMTTAQRTAIASPATGLCVYDSDDNQLYVYDSAAWSKANQTLQDAYDYSTSPEITLDSTRGGLTIRNASPSIGSSLVEVLDNGSSVIYFSVDENTTKALKLEVDNITVDGNTVSSSDANGDINLSPNGSGTVVINTDLDVDNVNINGNTISSTDANGDVTISPNGTGEVETTAPLLLNYESTPSAPSASKLKLYSKTGDGLYTFNSSSAEVQLADTSTSQTIQNKTLDNTNTITVQDTNLTIQDEGDNTKQLQLELANITTSTTRTLTSPNANGTLVLEDNSTTIQNKTLDNTNSLTIQDSNFTIQDNADNTKQLNIQLSGITTSTTRTLTAPDADGTLNTGTGTNNYLPKFSNGAEGILADSAVSDDGTNTDSSNNILRIGNGDTTANKQILANNGDANFPGLRYSETDNKWQFANDGTTWSDLGSGSGTSTVEVNSITNFNAETDTTGYSTYADAAGTSIVDATGGSPTVTWTRNTTTPLRGTGDFVLTKDAANRQGEGASYDFSIDNTDQHSVFTISFDATTSSAYTDGDVRVYIYDITNSTVIEPGPVELLAGEYGKYSAQFQTPASSTSLRLAFHVASTNANAYTVNIDNIYVGPSKRNFGTPVTYLGSLTTTGSWSTNTTYSGKYWRVADKLRGSVSVSLAGAPDATNLTITLPSSLSMDTTKLVTTGSKEGELGRVFIKDSGANYYAGAASYSSATALDIRYFNETGTGVFMSNVTQAAPVTFASGDLITIEFEVPILGWEPTSQMSDDSDSRDISARYTTNSAQSIPDVTQTIVNFNNKNPGYDTQNLVTTGASWKFTANVSGKYNVSAVVTLDDSSNWAAGEKAWLTLYKNGVAVATLDYFEAESATAALAVALSGSTEIYLVNGDYIDIRIYQGSGAAITLIADDNWNHVSIDKKQDPSSITANSLVAASYYTTAGQAVTNGNIIDFESSATYGYDLWGSVTTGASWKFTAPIAGKYHVSVGTLTQSVVATAGQVYSVMIYKNGALEKYLFFDYAHSTTSVQYSSFGSADVDMVRDDYIDIRFNETIPAVNLNTAAGTNFITIHRIGF